MPPKQSNSVPTRDSHSVYLNDGVLDHEHAIEPPSLNERGLTPQERS